MGNGVKGIIFDMDNTLLRSTIDFDALKRDVYQFLTSHEVLPVGFHLDEHTSSTIIEAAQKSNLLTDELTNQMWRIAEKHEVSGMHDADLEPGVKGVLTHLYGDYCLVVVTNNSIGAAEVALRANGVYEYFDLVIGREMMEALKPSPSGFLVALNTFKHISPSEWISVGDAWIDGKASAEAGIRFVSYQGDAKKMRANGVFPFSEIADIKELLDYLT
jgi:phosphoglycolate phosphatase